MDLMEHRDIFQRAISRWGEEAQHDQAIEECAELIIMLQHYRRKRIGDQQVVDELADVFLMLGQLVFMFGEEAFAEAVAGKLAKLNRLLQD